MAGDERAHVRNKSSISDLLKNELDRTVKFSLAKRVKTHILGKKQLIFLCFSLTSNSKRELVNLNLITMVRAKSSKQYASTSTRQNFFTFF